MSQSRSRSRILNVRNRLLSGESSCETILKETLSRLKACNSLNAVLKIREEEAFSYARSIDKKIAQKQDLNPMDGLFFGVKENLVQHSVETCASSAILKGFHSLYDATCVQGMVKGGAFPVATLNMDEFAMGSSNENSVHGPVENPVYPGKVPGGSSGGSCSVVGSGALDLSLGSDTGGSIRQPGAYCDVVGFKPSYGMVSRYGLMAFASSLDQVGPITRTVEDAALAMRFLSGKDARDATSLDWNESGFDSLGGCELQGKSLAVPDFVFLDGLEEAVKTRFELSCEKLKEAGIRIETVKVKNIEYSLQTYYLIACAEASSNLARYDTIRYGKSLCEAEDLIHHYTQNREKGLGKEVKRRILLGTYILSEGYYDAYYLKAQKVRNLIKQSLEEVLSSFDGILLPTSPVLPFDVGSRLNDPMKMYLSDLFTVPANLAGIPAISLPLGSGVGLQLMSSFGSDSELLSLAWAVESVLGEEE